MKYTYDAYIDWFLKVHKGDHRKAMAWLIGMMDVAQRELQRVYEGVDHPKANNYTMIEHIDQTLCKQEDK